LNAPPHVVYGRRTAVSGAPPNGHAMHKPPSASVRKDLVIDTWKTASSMDFGYFDKVESMTDVFWDAGTPFRERFDLLDLAATVEIACGKGRHAAQIVDRCPRLHLVDTSVDAAASARARFHDAPHVSVHLSDDGQTLPFLADGSATAVFSYDAMVHFEMLTMAGYLVEIARVLAPGGRALLHHSNYSANPAGGFMDNPHWRNFMSRDVMIHLASRAGLTMLDCHEMDWHAPRLDALSLMEKPV
jgi:SAM-dependent methyltransferase